MKLDLQQLPAHLNHSPQSIYLVCGDETLLVDEACDQIRNSAKTNGYDDRQVYQIDAQFDWQQLMVATGTLYYFHKNEYWNLDLLPNSLAMMAAPHCKTMRKTPTPMICG